MNENAPMGDVEVRSEESGLFFYVSVKDAYAAWVKDKSIWKISWKDQETKHVSRWRPVTKDSIVRYWNVLSIGRIMELFPAFQQLSDSELLWVNQIRADHHRTFATEEQQLASCVAKVLSDADFQKMYCA